MWYDTFKTLFLKELIYIFYNDIINNYILINHINVYNYDAYYLWIIIKTCFTVIHYVCANVQMKG